MPDEFFEALRSTGLPAPAAPVLRGPERRRHRRAPRRRSTRASRSSRASSRAGSATCCSGARRRNGVFGAKMMWNYFDDFRTGSPSFPASAGSTFNEALDEVFPKLRIIFVRRRDKVAQAVSLWKAIQTQQWRRSSSDEHAASQLAAEYDFRALKHLVDELHRWDARWEDWFHATGREPIRGHLRGVRRRPGGHRRARARRARRRSARAGRTSADEAPGRRPLATGWRASATTTPSTSSPSDVTGMVLVPGGEFVMGATGFYPEEQPVRRRLCRGFLDRLASRHERRVCGLRRRNGLCDEGGASARSGGLPGRTSRTPPSWRIGVRSTGPSRFAARFHAVVGVRAGCQLADAAGARLGSRRS